MTYPPQGNYPPQGGVPQYPQQGGYPPQQPQYGQQYPQQGGYPQQQYPQQGQYGPGTGGFGGPPPKKSKTGLWIGLGAGVLVIAAVAVTGFVAPGFFLSKKTDNAAAKPPAAPSATVAPPSAPSTSPSSSGSSTSTDPAVAAAAAKLLQALNSGDVTGATAMVCPTAGTFADPADIKDAATKGNHDLKPVATTNPDPMSVAFGGTEDFEGSHVATAVSATFAKSATNGYCVNIFIALMP